MELFALLFFGSIGLGALLTGSSDEEDIPPEEGTTQNGTDDVDELIGGSGDDILHGLAGDDTLRGEAGDDLIYGGDGSDTVEGGDGDDVLFADSVAFEEGGSSGNDVLRGGAGNDTLFDGSGDDELHGGDGDDELHAIYGDDVLYGNDGDDVLIAGGGHDDFGGNNILHGGAGNDFLRGVPGFNADGQVFLANELYGEEGNDELRGFGTLDGGAGDDILRAYATVGEDVTTTLTGGAGSDTFEIGFDFDPEEYTASGDPAPVFYDPVRITDFSPSTDTLRIGVPPEMAGSRSISTIGYGDRLEVVLDGPDGNAYVVAILEGLTGGIDVSNIHLVDYTTLT